MVWFHLFEHLQQERIDPVEHLAKILRQRGGEFETLARLWMSERQPLGMEKRSSEPLDRAQVMRHPAMGTAVQRVADDGMADGVEMHPDLMRATCVNGDAEQ
jgi:hypothetical protein